MDPSFYRLLQSSFKPRQIQETRVRQANPVTPVKRVDIKPRDLDLMTKTSYEGPSGRLSRKLDRDVSPFANEAASFTDNIDVTPVKALTSRHPVSLVKPKPRHDFGLRSRTPESSLVATKSPQGNKSFKHSLADQPRKPPRPKVQVYPVDDSVKQQLLQWLKSYSIVPRKTTTSHVPELCKDGAVLCQLINRLNGRVEVLKGVHLEPKRGSAVSANVNKLLSYLRDQQKMNSRYLFANQEIIEAQEDVVWGLLEDIQALYKGSNRSASKAAQSPMLEAKAEEYNLPRTPQREPVHPELRTLKSVPFSSATQNMLQSVQSDSRLVYTPEASFIEQTVSQGTKEEVKAWLSKLKLNYLVGHDGRHFLQDPMRNGVLLCELVSILEKATLHGVQWKPCSAQAALDNVEMALVVLREKRPVSVSLLRRSEDIVKGDAGVIWGLLSSLMKAYEGVQVQSTVKSELPYSQEDLKKLEVSLVTWLSTLNVADRPIMQLPCVIEDFRSGVLLCSLVSKVVGVRITGVFKPPRTPQLALANTRKALEVLRGLSRMSQQFTWKESELCDGDVTVILGLLEDLHRFSDGLPARKRGPGYHNDGPYFGRHGLPRSVSYSRDYSHNLEVLELATKQTTVSSVAPKPHPKPQYPFESPTSGNTSQLYETAGSPYKLNRVEPTQFKSPLRYQLSAKKNLLDISGLSERLSSTIDLAESKQFSWLGCLGLKVPNEVVLGEGVVEEYRSGVLLCEIIGKLETQEISGVHARPKTTAAALHNIAKGLGHLRQKKGFPRELFFVQDELLKGDAYILRRLLEAIGHIYKTKVQTLMKFHSRTQKGLLSKSLEKGVLRELFTN
jgi:hypothetical protein